MERSVHDALCVVKRVLESKNVVAGGGCVEAALSIYLENFATSLVSLSKQLNIINRSIKKKNGFNHCINYRVPGNNLLSLNSHVRYWSFLKLSR